MEDQVFHSAFSIHNSAFMDDLAKLLILFGGIMVVIGGALLLAGRIPFIGRLPGDFTFSTGGFTCFFPLATSILLSLLLNLLVQLAYWLSHRGP
jgi:hypothetical protein